MFLSSNDLNFFTHNKMIYLHTQLFHCQSSGVHLYLGLSAAGEKEDKWGKSLQVSGFLHLEPVDDDLGEIFN